MNTIEISIIKKYNSSTAIPIHYNNKSLTFSNDEAVNTKNLDLFMDMMQTESIEITDEPKVYYTWLYMQIRYPEFLHISLRWFVDHLGLVDISLEIDDYYNLMYHLNTVSGRILNYNAKQLKYISSLTHTKLKDLVYSMDADYNNLYSSTYACLLFTILTKNRIENGMCDSYKSTNICKEEVASSRRRSHHQKNRSNIIK